MEIKTSVLDIPLQNPSGEEFSAADLTWSKFATSEDYADNVALSSSLMAASKLLSAESAMLRSFRRGFTSRGGGKGNGEA